MEIRLAQDSEGQEILQYNELKSGSYKINNITIPRFGGNRDYKEMLSRISHGKAEIVHYSEPPKPLEDVRAERVLLLAEHIDIYNPIRWAELSADKKAKVKTYRQALLDITKQDPTSVAWPEAPLI